MLPGSEAPTFDPDFRGFAAGMKRWQGFAIRVRRRATLRVAFIVEARKLEHHYPNALKVKYKGS